MIVRFAVPAVCALLVLCACTGPRTEPVKPTADEQPLIDYLRRDAWVRIMRYDRDANGNLLIETQQGGLIRRYRIAPDSVADSTLRLHRIDESLRLEESHSAEGTAATGR